MTDPRASISDQDFAVLFSKLGAAELSRQLGLSLSAVKQRRRKVEEKLNIQIEAPYYQNNNPPRPKTYPHRIELDVPNGYVLIGSDAHIWPEIKTTAMRGFIKFSKEYKPAAVILNGDVMDFPQISKHDPLGWEIRHSVQEEIEYAQDILHDIEKAAGRARKIWTLGNHDARFEKRLAIRAPEYAKVHGMHLKDFFPLWEPCWATWINNDVVVKHRWKGGDHAPWNNTIRSGKSIVTAHLHSAKVTPYTDYNGTRYGVDDGCLADPDQKAFTDYTEDNPKNWRSGFCVLTFKNGKLLQPQLAIVHDENTLDFCGDLIPV